jgi:hypothetical protein
MTDGPGLDERCAYVGPWTFELVMAFEVAEREAEERVPDVPKDFDIRHPWRMA